MSSPHFPPRQSENERKKERRRHTVSVRLRLFGSCSFPTATDYYDGGIIQRLLNFLCTMFRGHIIQLPAYLKNPNRKSSCISHRHSQHRQTLFFTNKFRFFFFFFGGRRRRRRRRRNTVCRWKKEINFLPEKRRVAGVYTK